MSVVGKNIPHDSAEGHVSGQSQYVDDILPARNEVCVDFYWSPVSHGRIKSMDLSAAAAVPGVVGLYTCKDLGGNNHFGVATADEVLLAEDVVEFMGQPIVVVAAENKRALRKAKAAIQVEIEELPPVLTIDEAIAREQFIGSTRRIKRGDVDKAFAEAEYTLSSTFRNNGQDHFYLESMAAIAYPGENDQIVVHSSTQSPTEVQHVIAETLGLKQNQVVCVVKRMGGAFGGKETQAAQPAAMAALVALKTKRPARIVYNKDDDMQVTGKRHPFQNPYQVAFTAEGRITGLKCHLYSDGGCANDLSAAVMAKALLHIDNAYYIPNIDVSGTICKTNFPPNTAFRGFGSPQAVATIESIIEDIANFLKKDAADVRMLNCYGVDDCNTTHYGQVVEHNTLPRLFNAIIESADYKSRREEVARFNSSSRTQLKGLALTAVKFGISFGQKFLNQANALVNIYQDGTIQVSTGATEMGQGVNTHIRQLVAAEFGLDVASVIVMATSTEKNSNTAPTAASSGTDLNGLAALDACGRLKSRLVEVAASHFAEHAEGCVKSLEDIVFEGGLVFDRRRPVNTIAFAELVKLAFVKLVNLGERGFFARQGLHFNWESGPEKIGMGKPYAYFTNGCAVSEVLIDRLTGDLEVKRVDILMDLGRTINPGIARGQITGAFVQGMGWVTTEDLRYDDKGTLLTHSPTTYKIPNIQDIPLDFRIDWFDDENPLNLKGTKAFGEPPLLLGISVWAAVKNALSYIAGETVPELRLPATNEEILQRLTELAESTKAPERKERVLSG